MPSYGANEINLEHPQCRASKVLGGRRWRWGQDEGTRQQRGLAIRLGKRHDHRAVAVRSACGF